MPTQLRSAPTSLEQQRANDTHRWGVVALVLGVLLAYTYAFTQVSTMLRIAPPRDMAESVGVYIHHVWDDDRNVESKLHVPKTRRFKGDDERLIVFAILAAAFLCAYFLPLELKKPSSVLWFLIGLMPLYGARASIGLLAMHLAVYLSFHPNSKQRKQVSAVLGGSLAYLYFGGSEISSWAVVLALVCWSAAFFLAYPFVISSALRRPRLIALWRTLIVQSPIIVACSGAISERVEGSEWKIPLGLLLFFWQWERLMMYYADFKDGEIPKELGVLDYLSVFMVPGILPNWTYVHYVGQGYSYLSSRYLCEDKNKIVMAGVRLLGIAFFYLVLGDWMLAQAVSVIENTFDVPVYKYVTRLIAEYRKGTELGTPTVLLSTLFDQFRMFLVFGAITHFRVATWRLLGYHVDPQYNRFWQATNLVSLWGRWAFHYREFLVRCFYYPTFFRFFKKNLHVRVFFATFVATALGNHLWGHIPEVLYGAGLTSDALISVLRRWPYFLLLGAGISATQVYLMRKGRTRRPWTMDKRLILDVICAYLTFQYFSLIHIFARPRSDLTIWDLTKLFLKGFGLDLGGPG